MKYETSLLVGLISVLSLSSAACGLEGASAEESEVTSFGAQSPAAPFPNYRDFWDASGLVRVRIRQCDWSPVLAHPTASCYIDPGYVLVGGGAEIEGEGSPGALLTESFPSADLTTWFAASKDHLQSHPHRLRAYTVGLSLVGVSEAALRSYMTIVQTTSPTSNHPTAYAMLPSGYQLLGGGARTHYYGSGQLLTGSWPSSIQWGGRSKDHLAGDPGAVTSFAIGITAGPIPGFGTLDVLASSTSTGTSSGYGTTTITTPPGWVLTSIGGEATYAGAGRMLTDMIPYADAAYSVQGARIRSKDHLTASSGFTYAYQVYVTKQ